jgi:hypothetical protein
MISLPDEDIHALDALASAVYEASERGIVVPNPERLLINLVQNGWMLVRIPEPEDSDVRPEVQSPEKLL